VTCSCCQTGRCCDSFANSCSETNHSFCGYLGSRYSFSLGTCAPTACIALNGRSTCLVTDYCQCTGNFRTSTNVATCDCNALIAAGYEKGGCDWFNCTACDSATGTCVSACPAHRSCCAGTCCPVSQTCTAGTCTNRCSSPSTFCLKSTGATSVSFECCAPSQKCCGPSGCLSAANANFTVNVAVNDWVNTGVTVGTGASVAITATASCDRCAAGTVEWAGQGSTATPNGVPAGDCSNGNSVVLAICHMALIGKIGAGGTPFLVGSSYSGTPGAGLLYLRQNDTAVNDNRGTFTGTITTDPCPGYTPASVGEPIVYGPGEEPPQQLPGPGAALKSILSLAGIVSSPTCSCNARAAQMDSWGEWESLKRLPEICDWLKEEADKREMWFFRPAGYALVLAAVFLSALKRPFRGNNK